MSQYVVFVIAGLGAGAAYAAMAMAVVTTYRGTGVINFAQGAMAVWGVFVFDELRRSGDLVFAVGSVHVGRPGPWLAVLAGVVSAASMAVVVHLGVFRPLRRAPALARVVASVGVTLVLLALIIQRFGTTRRAVPATLRNDNVTAGSISFSQDRLWFTVLVLAIAAGLWAYGRFTRTGLATRAAAQNERGAVVLGYSPGRLAAVTWVLGTTVASLVAIVVAPSVGLEPVAWTLMVVPALACALIARFTSVGVACGAGLALGAIESVLTLLSSQSWWPGWATVGVAQSLPFLVIVVTLVIAGHRLPVRGSVLIDRLPAVIVTRPRPSRVMVLVAAGTLAVTLTQGSYRFGVITSMIVAIIALSLVVLTGLVGQISLAQAAFAGSAGFALSKIGTAVPFPLSLLLAAGAATVLGLLVGLPALRIRGVQLAVVTLAAGVAIEAFVFHNPTLSPSTGNPIPDANLFGVDLAARHGTDLARWPFGLLVLTLLTLACLAVSNIIRSATGRRFLAVRSKERAAASLGVNVEATKLVAFALSSFLAGLGGALIGYSRGQLSADSFTVAVSLTLLAFAYLGGITSVNGALVAGALGPLGIGYVVLDRNVALGERYLLVSGGLLRVTAILNPSGIAGRARETVDALRAPLNRRASAQPAPAERAAAERTPAPGPLPPSTALELS
jgi:branched-chain amino acid transport system permease protein